jgi:hypothetical protein
MIDDPALRHLGPYREKSETPRLLQGHIKSSHLSLLALHSSHLFTTALHIGNLKHQFSATSPIPCQSTAGPAANDQAVCSA